MDIFGYGVGHKDTGKPLGYTTRKVYDSKSAASGGLTRAKKLYSHMIKQYGHDCGYSDPADYIVVPLVAGVAQ